MVQIDKENCKACGRCVAACPKKCLALGDEFNAMGIRAVKYTGAGCVSCGLCRIFILYLESFVKEIPDEIHDLLRVNQVCPRAGIMPAKIEYFSEEIHVFEHIAVFRREFV